MPENGDKDNNDGGDDDVLITMTMMLERKLGHDDESGCFFPKSVTQQSLVSEFFHLLIYIFMLIYILIDFC